MSMIEIKNGSYREVSHWLQTGEIDLALLTAGGYVRGILQSGLIDQYEYLATMDARPGIGPWVNDSRKADKFQRYYHSVCLAHARGRNDGRSPEARRPCPNAEACAQYCARPRE